MQNVVVSICKFTGSYTVRDLVSVARSLPWPDCLEYNLTTGWVILNGLERLINKRPFISVKNSSSIGLTDFDNSVYIARRGFPSTHQIKLRVEFHTFHVHLEIYS